MTTCLFGCYANGYLIDRNSTASALFADLSSHCDYNPYALGSFQGMDCGEVNFPLFFHYSRPLSVNQSTDSSGGVIQFNWRLQLTFLQLLDIIAFLFISDKVKK